MFTSSNATSKTYWVIAESAAVTEGEGRTTLQPAVTSKFDRSVDRITSSSTNTIERPSRGLVMPMISRIRDENMDMRSRNVYQRTYKESGTFVGSTTLVTSSEIIQAQEY